MAAKTTKTTPLRAKQIASLYKQPMTMGQVAKRMRTSRESVRYSLHRYYPELVRPRGRARPVATTKEILKAAEHVNSWKALAKQTGYSVGALRGILNESGRLRSTSAQFIERRNADRRDALTKQLAVAARKLGHTPTVQNCLKHDHRLPGPSTFYRFFGSLRKAQKAAGLRPNSRLTPARAA